MAKTQVIEANKTAVNVTASFKNIGTNVLLHPHIFYLGIIIIQVTIVFSPFTTEVHTNTNMPTSKHTTANIRNIIIDFQLRIWNGHGTNFTSPSSLSNRFRSLERRRRM